MLLGGNALLIRLGGGRFTQDIDLARESKWPSVEDARAELEQLATLPAHDDDPFDFELPFASIHNDGDSYGYGAETGKIKARALLGTATFATFSIDITTHRHLDGPVDQVRLRPIIEHVSLNGLPTVPTTPVENHLADKICAMYAHYGSNGQTMSTRYRDLADIVRIVSALEFDAARLNTVLERETGRRRMPRPTAMTSPGSRWASEFPKAAADFAEFPREYHRLDAALHFAGACLDDVLSGSRSTGTWIPGRGWA